MGDRIRGAIGVDADCVEEVALLAVTAPTELSAAARARLGLRDDQVNALVRVTLRHLSRTLTSAEANALRSRIWRALTELPE